MAPQIQTSDYVRAGDCETMIMACESLSGIRCPYWAVKPSAAFYFLGNQLD